MSDESPAVDGPKLPIYSFAEFLEGVSPNTHVSLDDCWKSGYSGNHGKHMPFVLTPELQLHCDDEICGGIRIYRKEGNDNFLTEEVKSFFLHYRCSNCKNSTKIFALVMRASDEHGTGEALKLGEVPSFGPPVPSRLLKMIGPDREYLLKGRRCENHGLGVGAFTYYRRVVENQKSRILKEIIKVAETIGFSEGKLEILRAAEKESQFGKAMDMAKDALPESLLLNGKNPLRLLYSALSVGVHSLSDEQCLEVASSVRVVLVELAERLSQALKDEAELSRALKLLDEVKSVKN